MSQTDTSSKTLSLRLNGELHGLAKGIAEDKGIPLTDYIKSALRRAVAEELIASPTAADGEPTPFELHIQFSLTDAEADQRAYQIADGMTNFARLTGATELTSRLTRLATMQTRSDPQ